MDLTNPSPNLGWSLLERQGLISRGPVDCVMALALIHHLAISNNVPFNLIAKFFSSLGHYLIIEFVPKEDSQVQKLLSTRVDIFSEYNEKQFEVVFSKFYKTIIKKNINKSNRMLYLMKKK